MLVPYPTVNYNFLSKGASMQKILKLVILAVVSSTVCTTTMTAPAHAASPLGKELGPAIQRGDKGWCVPFTVPVAAAPGTPHNWKVAATYCQPHKWTPGKHEVDILTHGSTYTASYWD